MRPPLPSPWDANSTYTHTHTLNLREKCVEDEEVVARMQPENLSLTSTR